MPLNPPMSTGFVGTDYRNSAFTTMQTNNNLLAALGSTGGTKNKTKTSKQKIMKKKYLGGDGQNI